MVVFVPRVVVYFIRQSKGRHTFWMKMSLALKLHSLRLATFLLLFASS